MTTTQQRWHLRIWWVIGPALVIGFAVALNARQNRLVHSSLSAPTRVTTDGIAGKDRP